MFWIRRWLLAFAVAVVVIGLSHLLRSRGWPFAIEQGLLWGAISACVYVGALVYHVWRGRQCAMCVDNSEPR
jgi:hypothetical protein